MEQSVCMSWPDARPIAHLLLNSSFTARAAGVPRPSNKAPAKADVMFLRIGFVPDRIGVIFPSFIALAGRARPRISRSYKGIPYDQEGLIVTVTKPYSTAHTNDES